MRSFVHDLRFGLRHLRKSAGVTIAAVATLAIGLGASAIMFGAIHDILWQSLPFEGPAELVEVWARNPERGRSETGLTRAEVAEMRARLGELEIASYATGASNMARGAAVRRASTLHAEPELLSVLGVEPTIGRALRPAESGPAAPAVALISTGIWLEMFAGAGDVIGQEIQIDDVAHQVVGVLPPDFWLLTEVDLLVPLRLESDERSARHLSTVVRENEAGIDSLPTRLAPTMQRLARARPDTNEGLSAISIGQLGGRLVRGDTRPSILLLFVGTLFLLLICCVNVANLLLARGVSRTRELAVRVALGAGRRRLLAQLLAESLLLGLAGGAAGLAICLVGTRAIASQLPPDQIRAGIYAVGIDEVAFVLLASMAASIVFGLIPAMRAARADVVTGLRESALAGSAGRARLQKALVVFETALALSLLLGAGLAVRSYLLVQAQPPGFQPDGLLTFRAAPAAARLVGAQEQVEFQRQLATRLRDIPGVDAVGATTSLPMGRRTQFRYFAPEGVSFETPADRPRANVARVSEEYLAAMGTTLVEGRSFDSGDGAEGRPVVVLSEQVARRTWPDESPLGRRITFDPLDGEESPIWRTVIGIAEVARNNGLHNEPWDEIYVPFAQMPSNGPVTYVLRTTTAPSAFVEPVREAMGFAAPGVAAYEIRTMRQVMAARFWGESITTRLLAACGVASLVLAIVGLAGVVGYSVARRRSEIGVRMALGARGGHVVALVVRQALVLVVVGCVLGLIGGLGLSQGLRFMLYGVEPVDPITFLGVPVLLLLSSGLAALWPARRATKVNPASAFRAE